MLDVAKNMAQHTKLMKEKMDEIHQSISEAANNFG